MMEALVKDLPQGLATIFAIDAADAPAVLDAAKVILRDLGTPDVVVNCAGAGVWRFIEETPPSEARQMMDAPYFASFNLTHAFMPSMLKQRSGTIIHVNSPVSALGWPGATGYMATRWALRGLHEALTLDLAGTGVKSCHVVFSKVKSAYFTNNPGSEERVPAIARLVPELTPEQCADVLLDVIQRPRREVIHPAMLRVFYGLNFLFPWLVRFLAIRTGRRH